MSRLPKGYTREKGKELLKFRFSFEGKRYSVYGSTQKECEAKKAEKLELLKQHMHIENQKITLSKFFDRWLIVQERAVKPSTVWNYRKAWNYLSDKLGSRKIAKITKGDIIQMQNELLKETSANNINRITRLLSQLMNAAIEEQIISKNPCKGIKKLKVDLPKAAVTNHRALTETETKTFLENAEGTYYYWLFLFLLNTGCRIGEAAALTYFDVNYKKAEISIHKTVSRISNKEYVISDTPKNSSSIRTIPITPAIKEILEKQKEQNNMLFGSRQPLLFPNTKGELMSYTNVDTCIRGIVKKINGGAYFEKFSVHAFRDTFATRCIEQGMNPNTLKTLLGHSSYSMTMDLYAHVLPNTKQEELERICIAI